MTNREMEYILKAAANRMPEPEGELNFLIKKKESIEVSKSKKSFRVLKPVFATLVCFIGIGAVLFGALSYAGDDTDIGGWTAYRTKKGIERDYGVVLREHYGEYSLGDTSGIVCASNSFENVEDAFANMLYEWASVSYTKNDDQALSISIGSTDHELWKYVFSYTEDGESYDIEHLKEKNGYEILELEKIEYQNIELTFIQSVLHGEAFVDSKLESSKITWVDSEAGLCVIINVPYELVDKEQMLEYAITFIEDYSK